MPFWMRVHYRSTLSVLLLLPTTKAYRERPALGWRGSDRPHRQAESNSMQQPVAPLLFRHRLPRSTGRLIRRAADPASCASDRDAKAAVQACQLTRSTLLHAAGRHEAEAHRYIRRFGVARRSGLREPDCQAFLGIYPSGLTPVRVLHG